MSLGFQVIKTLGNTEPCTQKIIQSSSGSDISLDISTTSLCLRDGEKCLSKASTHLAPGCMFPLWLLECNHSMHTDEEAEVNRAKPLSKTSYCSCRSSRCPLASSLSPVNTEWAKWEQASRRHSKQSEGSSPLRGGHMKLATLGEPTHLGVVNSRHLREVLSAESAFGIFFPCEVFV